MPENFASFRCKFFIEMLKDLNELRMQGYTVSSRYDSDDYDDLLALSCDACSEQVRQNMICNVW